MGLYEANFLFANMAGSISQVYNVLLQYSFDIPNLSDRLKCVICHQILKNAKQTPCGCKVCDSCIRHYLSAGSKPCPSNQSDCNDSLTISDINQDNATNKEISNLKVKCPFKSCSFTDALKNVADHIDKCDYREIVCDKCKDKFPFNDKRKHDERDCKMREIKCEYCSVRMTHKDYVNVHLNCDSGDLCSEFIDHCPNKCEITDKVKLRVHLSECSNKKIECPFHSLSCEIGKMTKGDLIEHLKNEQISHSINLINKIKTLEKRVNELEKKLSEQRKETRNLMEKNKDSTTSRLHLEKSIEEVKKKTPAVQTQIVDNKSVIFRNASFIWKFTDFEVRRVEAENGGRVSVTSDPFYTSEFGYKMCLRIYPAGDGVGKGTHLSVFFAIMKGEFDDLLSWPFKQKVTLSILDQEAGSKHHSDTFKPDSRSACYQKPIDECNIASGSPKFIMLSQILNNSIYCRNDTIFIKITVDTMGISKP